MPILGVIASSISGNLWPANSYESIQTTTVGSGGSSSISFTSIPSTYTHLQVRFLGRSSTNNGGSSVNLYYRLNNDTASNYSQHTLRGDGANAFASGAASQGAMYPGAGIADAGSTASVFGAGVLDILDYANTNKNTTARLLNGFDRNGGGQIVLSSGAWYSTTAVNRLDLSTDGNWVEYSTFALYGIKGA
jgi:hypothetical protein